MPFGMTIPTAGDFADIVKFDARAGRMFRVDYDSDKREKTSVDITSPAPKFALDFGSLEVGYGRFSATGPDLRVVPEGQQIPVQPTDKDDKGKLLYRPCFRVKLYGKVLSGMREWASMAGCVLGAVDDLYNKFRAAPEAQTGKIPVVELTRTIPVAMGRGANQSTSYAPCFSIIGWTERVPEFGPRTVPVPNAAPLPTSGAPDAAVASAAATDALIDDAIPF